MNDFLREYDHAEMEEERKSFIQKVDKDIAAAREIIPSGHDLMKFNEAVADLKLAANRMFSSIAEAVLIAQKHIKR